jgi:uncharacterized protein YndB with AHSA1/START domain
MSPNEPRTLPPLHKSIVVPWTREAAFRRFTEEIGSWWPTHTHSVGGRETETVIFEGRLGGRIYERVRGGKECPWGTVTAWEPPARVVFTWHPGSRQELAQTVEVRFAEEGSRGTRLELTHTGWEKFGTLAKRLRGGYAMGWGYVLRHWAGREKSLVIWGIDALTWALTPLRKRLERRMEQQLRETAIP